MATSTFFASPLASKKLLVIATDGGKVNVDAPTGILSEFTLTLPSGTGVNGQFLQTDGSGVLSWVDASGGGGATTPGGVSGEIQYNSAGSFAGVASLVYNDPDMTFGQNVLNSHLYFYNASNYISYGNELHGGLGNTATFVMKSDAYLNMYGWVINLIGDPTGGTMDTKIIIDGDNGQLQIDALDNLQMNAYAINMQSRNTTYFASAANTDIVSDSRINLLSVSNIVLTADDNITIHSTDSANNAILMKAPSGGLEYSIKNEIYNIHHIKCGSTLADLMSTFFPGTALIPNSPYVYVYTQEQTGQTYHWDLTGFGVNGQMLCVFYDSQGTTNSLRINFGVDGIVSGSGNSSALTFESNGDSAQLICVHNSFGTRQWRIINTGAVVNANP